MLCSVQERFPSVHKALDCMPSTGAWGKCADEFSSVVGGEVGIPFQLAMRVSCRKATHVTTSCEALIRHPCTNADL